MCVLDAHRSGMVPERLSEETEVSDRGMVTIPVSIRRHLDIESGDKLQWRITGEEELSVEVVQQRYGAFADEDLKVDLGGERAETHDLTAQEEH